MVSFNIFIQVDSSTIYYFFVVLLCCLEILQAGMEKLWHGQEEQTKLLVSLSEELRARQAVTQENITNNLHQEVLHIYYDLTKVEQGHGKKLKDEFIMAIEKTCKTILSESMTPTFITTSCLGYVSHLLYALRLLISMHSSTGTVATQGCHGVDQAFACLFV